MNRRSFLALTSGLSLWAATRSLLPHPRASAASERAQKWAPSTAPLLGVEWRYVAGRIVDGDLDYGFIVTLTDVRIQQSYELLVERQDFTGDQAFATKSYTGTLAYDATSGTYTFSDDQNLTLATWQWDEAAQLYLLTVTTTELTMQNIVLRPQGTLIPEGGDGLINVEIAGVLVLSDYYADWTVIEINGAAHGVARVDMEGLRAATQTATPAATRDAAAPADNYDHHWFALAGERDGASIWVSAWRMETSHGPLWFVTIAHGSGTAWQVASTTEESGAAAPIAVEVLRWQPIPAIDGAAQPDTSTGSAWRITAGLSEPGDLIDLEIAVPPGQFGASARTYEVVGQTVSEEGVGTTAAGTIQGRPLSNVSLVVAESTAEFYLRYLPLVLGAAEA